MSSVIDVIIPVYNRASTIHKCLISIMMQTIVDKINVCIVDDCSTDELESVVKKFKKQLNIEYIKNKNNVGAGVSRQVGIDSTSSKYLFFLDSDDQLYDSYAMENILKTAELNNADITYGKIVNNFFECETEYIYNDANLHGKLYKREFLKKYDICFKEYRIHEDNYFNNKALLFYPTISYCENNIYIYKPRNGSITSGYYCYFLDTIDELVKMVLDLVNSVENKVSKKQIARYIYKVFGNVFYAYCLSEDYPNLEFVLENVILLYKKTQEYKTCLSDEEKNEIIYSFSDKDDVELPSKLADFVRMIEE